MITWILIFKLLVTLNMLKKHVLRRFGREIRSDIHELFSPKFISSTLLIL
ncbi:hypothetical protein M0804_007845 [Polistes exclamans]|nr:hypothetical protein M0804_007845 [Polistes exclamans]